MVILQICFQIRILTAWRRGNLPAGKNKNSLLLNYYFNYRILFLPVNIQFMFKINFARQLIFSPLELIFVFFMAKN